MKFLYGRYGIDILSIFLLFISSILNFTKYTYYLGLVVLILIIFRVFSKNILQREKENKKFITIANKFLKRFNKQLPYNISAINFDTLPYIKQAYNIYIKLKKISINLKKLEKKRKIKILR